MNTFTIYDSVDNNWGVRAYRPLVSKDGTSHAKGESNRSYRNSSPSLLLNDERLLLRKSRPNLPTRDCQWSICLLRMDGAYND